MKKAIVALLSPERSLQKLRLASGLVMLTFVAMHLINHAVLLVSLDSADRVLRAFAALWRSPPGTILLYGSLVTHLVLVLRSIYLRRTWRMPAREAVQIGLGLLIPFLIIEHVVPARLSQPLYGIVVDYRSVVHSLWVVNRLSGVRQSIALLVIWAHGCAGVYFWLRYRSWYRSAFPYLLTAAILVPVLGLLGFAEAGRTLADLPGSAPPLLDPALPRGLREAAPAVEPAIVAAGLNRIKLALYLVFAGAVALVLVLRRLRMLAERPSLVTISYSSGALVRMPRGLSLLEGSRYGNVPHYSVCGGKGRCSTCRVRILASDGPLPPPGPIEAATLARIHADADVRLGCQLHPAANLSVALLTAPNTDPGLPVAAEPVRPGREEEIVVLFCDLRNFTVLSEARLPYDVVFLLNRYFAIVGQEVERAGGRLDKFIGDGAMALFGLTGNRNDACRQALSAAAAIVRDMSKLNEELAPTFATRLKIAIGIHTGPSVVGVMGYGATKGLTAIGDTVNVASRLETTAKERNVAIVVSEPTIRRSGLQVGDLESCEVAIRGRSAPVRVYLVSAAESQRFIAAPQKA